MTRRRALPPLHPAFAWGLLALRAAEMTAASMQVIAHRTRRHNTPAQLFAMGNEKLQAAMESGYRMARHWHAIDPRTVAAMWNAWPGVLAAGLAPYRTRALRNARRASRR